jgi:hypothetical protein
MKIVASVAAVMKATSRASRHGRFLGLQVDFGHDAADLLFELFDMRLEPPDVGNPVQYDAKLIRRKRFGKVVEGPAPHGLDRRLDRGIGRHHHDVQARSHAQQARQQIEPFLLGQVKIEQGRIEGSAAKEFQCLRAVAGLCGTMSQYFQRHPQRAAEAGVVVNYKDIHGCRTGSQAYRSCILQIGRAFCELRS